MRIAFTGTSIGMTSRQIIALMDYLSDNQVTHLLHGDCVGADEQAHQVAKSLGVKQLLYPANGTIKRAFCQGGTLAQDAKPPLLRNRDIVDAGDVLIAAPKAFREEQRSGTWATIRYARKKGKRRLIIWPDGRIVEDKDGTILWD
jgi:hypothetical protein